MRCRFLIACALIFGFQVHSSGFEIGFRFVGTVSFPAAPMPFGVSIPAGTVVVGHFIFDVDSPMTHPLTCSGQCAGYRQQIPNGFTATFDTSVVRADDYVVVVSNDVDVIGSGGVIDSIAVMFAPRFALAAPLMVNETNQPDAQFNISLNADSTSFDNTSLPMGLSAETFPVAGRGGVLDNPMLSGIDLFFNEIEFQPLVRGDYNSDNVVDNLDYTFWRSEFGSSTALAADGNFNGVVDAADYLIWRRNIGAGLTSPANLSPAPEPTALTFLCVGSVCLSLRRDRFFRCRPTV